VVDGMVGGDCLAGGEALVAVTDGGICGDFKNRSKFLKKKRLFLAACASL